MTNVLRTCRRTWGRLGVDRRIAVEMADDLAADLAAAAEEGVSAQAYVGDDARAFAAQWAAARGLVRPRLRVVSCAAAAVVGAIPGASFGLFIAYGLSSQAIGDILGSPVRVGQNTFENRLDPPSWLLLALYALGVVFAYAGSIAAVAGFLRWRLDPLARETTRLVALALPAGAAAALGAAIAFAWLHGFSTRLPVVIGDVLVATAVFAGAAAIVRVGVLGRRRLGALDPDPA